MNDKERYGWEVRPLRETKKVSAYCLVCSWSFPIFSLTKHYVLKSRITVVKILIA
ncbi:unnamed protein product [Amoebophrya sp. A25]|nr:unnamed protein product [Amoebophrya sp. A25]|eukprot:GSA25T00009445001.1